MNSSGGRAKREQTYPLTPEGDILFVPTPGHSPGHQSVIVIGDDVDVMIAGDASLDVAQVRDEIVAGIAADVGAARTTLRMIKTHLQQRPTIYLPSHDPASASQLRGGTIGAL